MTETLPATDPVAGRSVERLDRARLEQDDRVTTLFRRWPDLSDAEIAELRSLWDRQIAERRDRSKARAADLASAFLADRDPAR